MQGKCTLRQLCKTFLALNLAGGCSSRRKHSKVRRVMSDSVSFLRRQGAFKARRCEAKFVQGHICEGTVFRGT